MVLFLCLLAPVWRWCCCGRPETSSRRPTLWWTKAHLSSVRVVLSRSSSMWPFSSRCCSTARTRISSSAEPDNTGTFLQVWSYKPKVKCWYFQGKALNGSFISTPQFYPWATPSWLFKDKATLTVNVLLDEVFFFSFFVLLNETEWDGPFSGQKV